MPQYISVRFLPKLIDPAAMADATAVIIDVLRASTTICTALSGGARQILPCLEIPQAGDLKTAGQADLCGGERGGVKIDGFDFGNSPFDYSQQAVAGKTIAFTTTNGTRAMQACQSAARVYIAAFVNLASVAQAIQADAKIELVCAGTDGEITEEDVLFAGALVERLKEYQAAKQADVELNDQAHIALSDWQSLTADDLVSRLSQRMRLSHGGRNLVQLGYARDIDFAAQIDTLDILPQLDLKNWTIQRG